MSNEVNKPLPSKSAVTAKVRVKKGFSIVWLIPLIALVIGGWLAYKSFSEKGPLIRISFKTAEGLEAGKTKIKYKDVIVGEVEEIHLAEAIDGVVVLARMNNEVKPYLTDKSRFWVVRAMVSAGRISALGTLLSGAYIGIDPISEGLPTKKYVGLEKQPLVTANVPGHHYLLRSPTLDSLDISSPVFYRQIKVGEVVDYDLDASGEFVNVKIFVHAPHHLRVNAATKFWNASGVDITLDASGVKINTQSIVSILQGGISFDTPASLDAKSEISEDFQFQLFPNEKEAKEKLYTVKTYHLMYFDQSVRGLTPGAPVEFRGIQIGEVIEVRLIFDADSLNIKIPVLVMIESERMEILHDGRVVDYQTADKELSNAEAVLLKRGLRAQLKTGNLLTGQLYIDMDIFPDAEPAEIVYDNGYPVFPTVPSALGQITEEINSVLKKIDAIPFEELGENLNETIVTLRSTLKEFGGVAGNVNRQVLPKLNKTMEDLQETMAGLKNSFGTDSALNFKAQQAIDELTGAIRSIRSVADQLDRNPRALIFGRGEAKP